MTLLSGKAAKWASNVLAELLLCVEVELVGFKSMAKYF